MEGLEALAEKYRELIALRNDPSRDDARLRALAARFPGALRELDTRTMASLEERARELREAIAGGPAPSWADAQLRFHGWLRIALELRARGALDLDAARTWARGYVPREPGDPQPDALTDSTLAILVEPPDGRVSRAAKRLVGGEDAALDALLFG